MCRLDPKRTGRLLRPEVGDIHTCIRVRDERGQANAFQDE